MIRKCSCPACGQRIEFDSDDFQAGDSYPCPTCEADFAPVPTAGESVQPSQASGAVPSEPLRVLSEASGELLASCRRVSADGVLTGDEIWVLAEWLNAHPEATKEWPGEVLAAPLAEAFRDGELQPEELQSLAAVLAGIERASGHAQEPVRLEAGPAAPTAAPSGSGVAGTPIEVLPFPHRTQVRADVGDAIYEVDLEGQTCTCPDWTERRASLPFKDPGRCCKHIVRAIFEAGLMDELDPAVGAVLLECLFRGGGTVPGARYTRLRSGNEEGVISLVDGPWVNVFTRSGADWDKHAFNCEERRWSYGAAPEGWAKVLRGFLDRV